jgi:sialic acid synthase SpsE/quercetin dioxygenase-like cupin family protein
MKIIPAPLFIFEMANNHMGDIEHGIRIVREFREITKGFEQFHFSIKLQHRDDSFIHPDYRHRHEYKYIKRFTETKLSKDDFKRLKDEIQNHGFISMCTPWDEPSVDLMEELDFDIIKIASCSFTDWPLLEKCVKTKRPIIASTAAAELEDIDRVVSFFAHRDKSFAIMHCVGEYPCRREHLEMNQINFFRERYPNVMIGFSTHEDPASLDPVKIAVGKGALLFEKHVAVPTTKYSANAYSATPEQTRHWLEAAADAYEMCGVVDQRRDIFAKEIEDIRPLQRGVFASVEIKKGEKLSERNYFGAMPNQEGQLLTHALSKYSEFYAERDFEKNAPLLSRDLRCKDLRAQVKQIADKLRETLKRSGIALPPFVELEISHHYGLDRFDEWGAVLIKIINRAYSKILVVMFPGQSYPRHRHVEKDETYHLLQGDLTVQTDLEEAKLRPGDIFSVDRGNLHSFNTSGGAIIEEVATTYIQGDSIYEDDEINKTSNRKILLTFWPDWLND